MLFFSSPIQELLDHIYLFDLKQFSQHGFFNTLLKNQLDDNLNEKYSMLYIRHAWFLQYFCLHREIMISFSDSINKDTPLQRFIDVLGIQIIKKEYQEYFQSGFNEIEISQNRFSLLSNNEKSPIINNNLAPEHPAPKQH